VQRALTDFGAKNPLDKQLSEEHYVGEINRATVRREVKKALKAQKFVEVQLFIARLRSLKSLTRPNIEQLLVELDGCHIRTGILLPVEKAGYQKRRLLKRKRESDWKEVSGFSRPVRGKTDERNARMSKYPEVVGQSLAQCLTKGCRNKPKFTLLQMEAMGYAKAKQSFQLTFILDRPHLKTAPYEGAEAVVLQVLSVSKCGGDKLHIDAGDVRQVIRTLKGISGSRAGAHH